MNYEQLMQTAVAVLADFGFDLLAAIAILVIGLWVAKALRRGVQRLLIRTEFDQILVRFIGNIVYAALLVFVVLAAIAQLGVQTASFIALIGAAGLAIGLALQGSLANFAAGVLMLIFRPFKAGDYVECAGTAGIVEDVQIFSTRLRTPDNRLVIVPNGAVYGDTITNYSALDRRRVDLVYGVSYADDIDNVKQVIADVLARDQRILKDPAPTIGLVELADSSVNFAVRPWVATADYWPVVFDLNETIKKRFDAEGISIPFPQRDVHVHGSAATAARSAA
ncbi:MAG TPA: mechanosensitive ion channel domain-containing protein [Steroidobacteraceae bacterium]|nr:mechanosensitive ion channel domain-containing protein [Steroidobacteraceae bacterium]